MSATVVGAMPYLMSDRGDSLEAALKIDRDQLLALAVCETRPHAVSNR
jgi:hypothetical protein